MADKSESKKMKKKTEKKVGYIIGVTAGIFSAAQQEEKQRYAGLYWKANYALTRGVDFLQVDLESVSEFQEPNIKENMQKFYDLNLTAGLHSETPAFGSREFPHLDSAISVDYRRSHDRLLHILKETGNLGFDYMLMHSSESTPFIFLAREFQPTDIVDIWGRPIRIFVEQEGKKPSGKKILLGEKNEKGEDLYYEENWIKDWLWDKKQRGLLIRVLGADAEAYLKEEINKELEKRKTEASRKGQELKEEELKLTKEDEEKITARAKYDLFNRFFFRLESRDLSYGSEQIAYFIIAYWMQHNNDSLWNNMIDSSAKYYMKKDGKETLEEWLQWKGIKNFKDIDDLKFRENYSLWVPSVSAKYLWGHFMPETCKDEGHVDTYGDPKKVLREQKIFFALETPMAGAGMEDLLRFPQPVQMYHLIKEIDKNNEGLMAIAIDLEHMLMDGLNIDYALDILPEDAGKYIRVVHTGWPSPLGPAHIPIPVGSEQQRYLYDVYFKLRQKGMGKENSCYIIFERAGGEDPFKQSVIALRMIRDYLEKDVPPSKLPPEFYGISPEGFMSEQRQLAIIKEHYWDPLKDLLERPEEDYGFLGTAALGKGKRPEDWKREELK